MPHESFEKFMENLTGHYKAEDELSAYEKFGNTTKTKKRKITREHMEILRRAPATLDLHGRTVAESETAVSGFIAKHVGETVVIITGRSGKLRNLFPEWADGFLRPYISQYKLLPTGGSYEVILRKNKSCA
jgi:DNA-nicking Smr family endonuclease